MLKCDPGRDSPRCLASVPMVMPGWFAVVVNSQRHDFATFRGNHAAKKKQVEH